MTEPACFPVSVKGVVLTGVPDAPRVALLQNERDEWELPGGKLEPGESPEACLIREIHEELNLSVTPGPILDVWVYRAAERTEVVIVTYGCYVEPFTEVATSAEHRAARLFDLGDVPRLRLPEGYRPSIRAWAERLGASALTHRSRP